MHLEGTNRAQYIALMMLDLSVQITDFYELFYKIQRLRKIGFYRSEAPIYVHE